MTGQRQEDNTWYVAVERVVGTQRYISFMGAGGETYRRYAEIAGEGGFFEVVAEEFGVSDETVNRLTGFDENGRRIRDNPLARLVEDAAAGRIPDVKKALADLCKNN